jgi:hypothetical protein
MIYFCGILISDEKKMSVTYMNILNDKDYEAKKDYETRYEFMKITLEDKIEEMKNKIPTLRDTVKVYDLFQRLIILENALDDLHNCNIKNFTQIKTYIDKITFE